MALLRAKSANEFFGRARPRARLRHLDERLILGVANAVLKALSFFFFPSTLCLSLDKNPASPYSTPSFTASLPFIRLKTLISLGSRTNVGLLLFFYSRDLDEKDCGKTAKRQVVPRSWARIV